MEGSHRSVIGDYHWDFITDCFDIYGTAEDHENIAGSDATG